MCIFRELDLCSSHKHRHPLSTTISLKIYLRQHRHERKNHMRPDRVSRS